MKLTDAQVVQIRNDYADGATQQELADRYVVTQSMISMIVRYKRRSSLGLRLLQAARGEGR